MRYTHLTAKLVMGVAVVLGGFNSPYVHLDANSPGARSQNIAVSFAAP